MIRRLILLALCCQAMFLTASKCSDKKDAPEGSMSGQSDMPSDSMNEPGSESAPAAMDEGGSWQEDSGAAGTPGESQEATMGDDIPE